VRDPAPLKEKKESDVRRCCRLFVEERKKKRKKERKRERERKINLLGAFNVDITPTVGGYLCGGRGQIN
jgi:hypothetical protein